MATPSSTSVAASLVARREQAVPRGVAVTHPVAIARAEGATVWDTDGREYLDFTSGISVLNVGHRHPDVVAAVRRQLDTMTHVCFQVATYGPYVELAERLGALVGGPPRKTLLLSTGAEATENAIKIARAHTRRSAVIAFAGGFHGRTLLALTMTATGAAYRQNFGPFAADVHHVPYPDAYHGVSVADALTALDELMTTRVPADQIAAIIIEPQLGEGGFLAAPPEFLRALRALATRHGIVLVADEIQCGFGRTGRMWGFEHSGIEPDLVAMAKSLGGGLPLSAVVGTAAIMDAPAPGGLGGTYAGNPLACAAALAVLDIYEREDLVARAADLGATLRAGLEELQAKTPAIGDVRGMGAMLAFELVTDRESRAPDAALTQRLVARARERGLLLLSCGPHKNVIRLLPPLNVTDQQVAEAITILKACM